MASDPNQSAAHQHDHDHDHDHAHSHDHDHDAGVSDCGHEHRPDGTHICHHGSLAEHREGSDLICLDRVTFRYGQVAALQDITLHVEAGCNLGIIGPNGGGKTTLLKIMLGLLEGYSGSVHINGLPPREVCRRGDVVGYVPQKHEFEQRFPVSVRQVAQMGLVGKTGLFRKHAKEDLERIDQLLELLQITDLAERPIGQLSGGQQQRAFIARALAAGPELLFLDEPTIGLDVSGQKRFADLIHTLHAELKLTIVVVSHQLATVAASCGKVAVLSKTLHYHDTPGQLSADLLREIFEHDIAPVLE